MPKIVLDLMVSLFVTVYASNNWVEDFAELATVYLMNKNFESHYKIGIIENGKLLFEFEPLQNELIKSRILKIKEYLE